MKIKDPIVIKAGSLFSVCNITTDYKSYNHHSIDLYNSNINYGDGGIVGQNIRNGDLFICSSITLMNLSVFAYRKAIIALLSCKDRSLQEHTVSITAITLALQPSESNEKILKLNFSLDEFNSSSQIRYRSLLDNDKNDLIVDYITIPYQLLKVYNLELITG